MKRMPTSIFSYTAVVIVICGTILMSFKSGWAADEIITLKFASHFPATHFSVKDDKKWCEKIEKETNGRVKFEYYAGATLMDPKKAWFELSQGVADVATLSIVFAPGFDIAMALGNFQYGTDLETLRKILPKVTRKFPEIEDEFKANKVLAWAGHVPEYVCSSRKKPLRSIDDFKGLQFKPAAAIPGLVEKLGGIPVRIPFVETYNAIDKGVIDAAILPTELLKGLRVAEVTKYHTIMHLPSYTPGALRAMSWDAWNKLPADIQKIIEDSIPWYNDMNVSSKIETNDSGTDYAKKLGDEIITMAPEEYEKLYVIMDELASKTAAKLDAKGKPGTEIYKYTRQLIEEEKAK